MTRQETGDFCYDFARDAGGEISFRVSDDVRAYPWLNLPPAHNIAVQATNYFALTGASLFAGAMDREKWTALTAFEWRVYDTGGNANHPAAGRAAMGEAGLGYRCRFRDAAGAPVYDVSGAGVVFRNRDFEAWRAKSKAEAMAAPTPEGFSFAPPESVGVKTADEVFITPVNDDARGRFVDALITAAKGFRPAHPYHGGSGDHVNSSHLCDVAQQAAHLVRGDGAFPSGGAARFQRYVELERPFRVRIWGGDKTAGRLDFAIEQAGRACADITFEFDD